MKDINIDERYNMTAYDNDIIKITNWLLQQLPNNEPFIFDDEYKKLTESINVKADTRFYLAATMYGANVFRFMNNHSYLEQHKDGRDLLSDEGREVKKLGHDEYQQRVADKEDGEWYKSKLARKQYEDYPNLIKRNWIAIVISIIAVVIAATSLWIKSKAQ